MPDFGKIREALARVWAAINELSLAKKAAIMVTAAVAISLMGFLYQLSDNSNYMEVLFSGLKTEDISKIALSLDKLNVPYQIQSEEGAITVPAEKVLDTRMKLAEQGLPSTAGVGFELFDKKTFGMTEFEQRLNFQRALQGELVRTINELDEVEDSRVHLVLPEKTIFAQSRDVPTASVVIKLAQDKKLSEARVQGIVNLVSKSVANLDEKNVTVVDTTGRLLTPGDGADSPAAVMRKRLDIERDYENKIRALMEPIVGIGKVQVQVTAELDFTEKETTEEKFDPDSIAVRSEKRGKITETNSTNSASGVVGANPQKPEGTGTKDKNEQNEAIEYEVSKQIQRIVAPTGELKKVSVAVVVDGITKLDEEGNPQYTARSAEELQNFEDLVKSAIGFQKDRGDQLKVMNLAFQNIDQMFTDTSSSAWESMASGKNKFIFYLNLLTKVIVALVAVLFVVFVLRPMLMAFGIKAQSAPEQTEGSETPKLDEKQQKLLAETQIKNEIQKQAISDPDNMVNVLRSWLSS